MEEKVLYTPEDVKEIGLSFICALQADIIEDDVLDDFDHKEAVKFLGSLCCVMRNSNLCEQLKILYHNADI